MRQECVKSNIATLLIAGLYTSPCSIGVDREASGHSPIPNTLLLMVLPNVLRLIGMEEPVQQAEGNEGVPTDYRAPK